jgi:Fe-S oxidoreductase/nitrate reductase gamma subunit
MPERPEFWGIPQPLGPILVYTLVGLAAVYLLVRVFLAARLWWQVGRHERRWDRLPERFWRVVKYAIAQLRVLAQTYPGVMHVAIAWTFFLFFLATAMGTINGHFIRFLRGDVFLVYKFVLDVATLVFLVGIGMAAYRRFVQRPERLTLEPRFAVSLGLLTFIVLLGPFIESFRLAITRPAWGWSSPLGWALAQIWIAAAVSTPALHTLHQIFYSLHVLAVIGLFITIPTSTLLHIFTAPAAVFFARLDHPAGQLVPQAQTSQGEPVFASDIRGLTWKQLLDADACTECGRCQEVCPAHLSGLALSPKQVMLSVRAALHNGTGKLRDTKPATLALIGDRIKDEALWACTTCRACMQECPIFIEHIDTIVDMRRYLINEGRMDARLQDALGNLGRYGNSFGQSERARARWMQPLGVKIKDARKEPVEYLWFVGDYASYSPALSEITRITATVFHKAGLDFGILYEGERNAGNDVRRAGEEGLFEILVEKNAAVLRKCDFKAIITTDPHSYNTLKNEYPGDALGGRPVLHYSMLLDELIASGQLKLSNKLGYRVTYHDPCYLGRYNGVYDAPRRVIAATGCRLVEMPRHADRALCCSAGGGRIWMEEGPVKERPSEIRMREAAALGGVSVCAVACPKDVTMFRDAVKTTQLEARLAVKDLIELVSEAV